MLITRKLKKNLRKRKKPTTFSAMRRNARLLISTATPVLILPWVDAPVRLVLAAVVVTSVMSLVMSSVIFSAEVAVVAGVVVQRVAPT